MNNKYSDMRRRHLDGNITAEAGYVVPITVHIPTVVKY